MIGLSKLSEAMLGLQTWAYGLNVAPTSPASLAVTVGIGQIYSAEPVDSSAYGVLPADTNDTILKQGLLMTAQTLNTPAPSTAGYSINYLIEAAYQDQDTTNVVLPYFNSANPSQPLSGQNNSGTAQPTERQGLCVVQVKAGAAAITGTQTTPVVDAGYIGLAVVTVANGQATVTASNIAAFSNAPVTGNLLNMLQNGSASYAADVGTANAYAVNLSPPVTALTDGMTVKFRALNTNTGASTLNLNGLGAVAITAQGVALGAGQIIAGGDYALTYSSAAAAWRLMAQSAGAISVANALAANEAVALGQFTQNLAGNGYQILPSGLIIQWGQATGSASGDVTVTFPIAFPNAIFKGPIPGIDASGAGYMVSITSASTSSFAAGTYSAAATRAGATFTWIALGN